MFKNFVKTGNTEPYSFSLYIGFFAGLIFSVLRGIAYYLKFTPYSPMFLIDEMFGQVNKNSWFSFTLGTISFVLFSILCTFIYMLMFRTKRGAVWGMGYGVAWWAILYLIFPLFMNWPTLEINNGLDILAIELCFFVVWGLFIGYSIAFEFTDESSHESLFAK